MAKRVAHTNMKEFDPTYERHYPLLIVKTVDPGCTIELQIENSLTGEITRITSTESPDEDERVMVAKLTEVFLDAWARQQ